ncbi:hypothetical protein NL676_039551 [Syzygium grande]|nr:hypothetical protein NL676_039551 [Syzygium grande]
MLSALGIRIKAALACNERADTAQEVFDEMTERQEESTFSRSSITSHSLVPPHHLSIGPSSVHTFKMAGTVLLRRYWELAICAILTMYLFEGRGVLRSN